ncbi:hypothetical protein KC725_04765 [Candidatus Peregrinibacteria bacterium]|nr:hypothetical protein [Candidatus Peregrinibacteria bacterium]
MSSGYNTPSTLPPVAPNAAMEFHTPKREEKRSTNPQEQLSRRLFDRYWKILRRYSVEPQDMNNAEVETFLREEVEELKGLDSAIKLQYLRQKGAIDSEKNDIKVGVYRLVYPKIKDLNDVYLGPNKTDDFTAELNRKITEVFNANSGHILSSNYKGGTFTINFTELNGHARDPEEFLMRKIAEIHEEAKKILARHILERLKILHDTKQSLIAQLSQEDLNEQTLQEITIRINKIDDNIPKIEALLDEIKNGGSKLDITFGFDNLKPDVEGALTSIRNAECAANIASLTNGEKKRLQIYSDEDFIYAIVKTVQYLGELNVLDENGIKPEWQDFFELDEHEEIHMKGDMIRKFRKIEAYRKKSAYREMSPEERKTFDDKITKFGNYYRKVNVVDVLKNYMVKNKDHYKKRVQRISALIVEAERTLEKSDYVRPEWHTMRQLLEQTSQELEISLKDEGEEIIKTTRAAIKSLIQTEDERSDQETLMIFGDNIGFGALNIRSYEQSILDIIYEMGFTTNDFLAMQESDEQMREVITQKVALLQKSQGIQDSILGIGDKGTQYLRHRERKIWEAFGSSGIINADGGDEIAIFVPMQVGQEISEAEIRSTLQTCVDDTLTFHGFKPEDMSKTRLAGVHTNFHMPSMTRLEDRMIVSDHAREAIITYKREIIDYGTEDAPNLSKIIEEDTGTCRALYKKFRVENLDKAA